MNILDDVSFGKIVEIREVLIKTAARGETVYRFESGDPQFKISKAQTDAIIEDASKASMRYVPNAGLPPLRKAIAKKLKEENRFQDVSENDVYVTNGAMHALYCTYKILLSEGDEVIVPEPMWTEAVENIRLAAGVPVPVLLKKEDGFIYRADDIKKKITKKTKAIFLNSPHNPTGSIIPRPELERIIELAKKEDLWLISDEAYEHLTVNHVSSQSLTNYNKVISVFSTSKSYCMAGLRVGYVVINKDQTLLRERMEKILRCSINGVNRLGQIAAIGAISDPNIKSFTEEQRLKYLALRDTMLDIIRKDFSQYLDPYVPEGAFYIWCKITPKLLTDLGCKTDVELSDKLANVGIGSAPGTAFGSQCTDAIRFSYAAVNKQEIIDGFAKIKKLLS